MPGATMEITSTRRIRSMRRSRMEPQQPLRPRCRFRPETLPRCRRLGRWHAVHTIGTLDATHCRRWIPAAPRHPTIRPSLTRGVSALAASDKTAGGHEIRSALIVYSGPTQSTRRLCTEMHTTTPSCPVLLSRAGLSGRSSGVAPTPLPAPAQHASSTTCRPGAHLSACLGEDASGTRRENNRRLNETAVGQAICCRSLT